MTKRVLMHSALLAAIRPTIDPLLPPLCSFSPPARALSLFPGDKFPTATSTLTSATRVARPNRQTLRAAFSLSHSFRTFSSSYSPRRIENLRLGRPGVARASKSKKERTRMTRSVNKNVRLARVAATFFFHVLRSSTTPSHFASFFLSLVFIMRLNKSTKCKRPRSPLLPFFFSLSRSLSFSDFGFILLIKRLTNPSPATLAPLRFTLSRSIKHPICRKSLSLILIFLHCFRFCPFPLVRKRAFLDLSIRSFLNRFFRCRIGRMKKKISFCDMLRFANLGCDYIFQ